MAARPLDLDVDARWDVFFMHTHCLEIIRSQLVVRILPADQAVRPLAVETSFDSSRLVPKDGTADLAAGSVGDFLL